MRMPRIGVVISGSHVQQGAVPLAEHRTCPTKVNGFDMRTQSLG